MNTTLTIVSIVVVVAVLAIAAWVFLVAPIVLPHRHHGHIES
jgi:hypothetical protein